MKLLLKDMKMSDHDLLSTFTKLRLRDHDLNIEKGRHKKFDLLNVSVIFAMIRRTYAV